MKPDNPCSSCAFFYADPQSSRFGWCQHPGRVTPGGMSPSVSADWHTCEKHDGKPCPVCGGEMRQTQSGLYCRDKQCPGAA